MQVEPGGRYPPFRLSRPAPGAFSGGREKESEMDKKTDVTLLAARIGIALIFLLSGVGKVAGWSGAVAHAGSQGVTPILLALATALEIYGAISLIAGWKTRWGGVALIVFLVPVTLVFHAFWAAPAAEVQHQATQFLKNVAMGGGLLAIIASGPGALSVDARMARPEEGGPQVRLAA